MKKTLKERRSNRRAWLKFLDELRVRLYRQRLRKKRLSVIWLLFLILMARIQIRIFYYDPPLVAHPGPDLVTSNNTTYMMNDEDRRVLDEQLRIEAEMLARPRPRIPGFPDRYAYQIPSLAALIRDLQNPWSQDDAFDVMLKITPKELHPWMTAALQEDGHRQFRLCVGPETKEILTRFNRASTLWNAGRNPPPDNDHPGPEGSQPAP